MPRFEFRDIAWKKLLREAANSARITLKIIHFDIISLFFSKFSWKSNKNENGKGKKMNCFARIDIVDNVERHIHLRSKDCKQRNMPQ